MVVVTPTSHIYLLTPDRKYIVQETQEDWVLVKDNSGTSRWYKAHLFIEADIYYTMTLFLTFIRLYNINPNHLK